MQTVREFTVEELDRIARPGVATPTLFWMLPLGKLESQAHQRIRTLFSKEYATLKGIALPTHLCSDEALSFCRDLGALLVREDQLNSDMAIQRRSHRDDRHRRDESLPINALQSELRRVLSQRETDLPSFLVLSSAFPEPGWAVLLQPTDENSHWGEALLRNLCDLWATVAHTLTATQAEQLEIVATALRCFKAFESIEAAQHTCDASSLEQQEDLLGKLKAQLTAFLRSAGREDWAGTRRAFGFLVKPLRQCIAVPRLSGELFETRLSNVEEFFSGIPEIQFHVAFRLSAGESLEHPSFAGMLAALPPDDIAQLRAAPSQWAQRFVGQMSSVLIPKARELLTNGVPKAQMFLQAEREGLMKAEGDWQTARKQRMEDMVTSTANSLAACRMVGPHLLVAIEWAARRCGFNALCLAEDRPRMVGWKLAACGASLRSDHLIAHIQDLLPVEHRLKDVPKIEVLGTHFTDYVHYVARHSPDQHPRDITLRVLMQSLDPEQLRMLAAHFGQADAPADASQSRLVDVCLTAMGWPRPMERLTVSPLRDFLLPRELHDAGREVSGPELRRSAESFSKDLLLVVIGQLPGGPSRAEDILRKQEVQLHYGVAKGLRMLTLGEAQRWIKELCLILFPGKQEAVGRVRGGLEELNELTKPWVHHWDDSRVEELLKEHHAVSGDLRAVLNARTPGLVQQLLDAAAALILEMPWHVNLRTTTVVGDCRVATVTGWSHSHSGKTNTREILLWHGHDIHDDAVVWNQGGLNPVMTDCHFLDEFLREDQAAFGQTDLHL